MMSAMKVPLPMSIWPLLLVCALVQAAQVSRLEVRIVAGAQELSPGSSLELRVYEAGKRPRRFQLVHGESWERDSTHIIPVQMSEPLDPRSVLRYSLYYRAASPLAPAFEIVSADVGVPSDKGMPERLLGATLSGVIARQSELSTADRDLKSLTCVTDADCDDKLTCNGRERCAPRSAGADARGCVKGMPVVCPVNQVCGEGGGCRGIPQPGP